MPNARRSLTFTFFVLVVFSAAAFGVPAILHSHSPMLTPICEFLGMSPESLSIEPPLAEGSFGRSGVSAADDGGITNSASSKPNDSLLAGKLATTAQFTPGDIVLYRVGDGTAGLNSNATAVFLDEFSPTGTLVQSIAMPTSVNGSQKRLTASGSATSEGFLTRSVDGRYLVLPGYDAALGTGSITTSTSAVVNRVIGRIDASGSVDTSTALTDGISGGNPRGAASTNGTDFWISGTSSGGGIRYASFGATTSTALGTSPTTNLRNVSIYDNQLYISTGATLTTRLATVGSGTPTADPQTISNLPGFPTNTGSPNAYFFADLSAAAAGSDTLYVADDTGGGIQKYSLVSGSWIARGSIALAGVRGLTASVDGSTVTLFVTTASTLQKLVDSSGYNSTISGALSSIATAGTNTGFRGVAFAPISAGTPEMNVTGNFVSIADGDVTPSMADGTDFGNVSIGGGSGNTFTIENTGTSTLTLTLPISITGSDFSQFQIDDVGSTTIAAGGSTTLTVSCHPTATGTKSAGLSISNNDADENPYNFSLKCTGTAPIASASPTILDFGDQTVGTTSEPQTLTISNTGNADLQVTSITSNSGDYTIVDSVPTTVAPGGNTTASIKFSPSVVGSDNAQLTIASNDPFSPMKTVSLLGTGVDIPDISVEDFNSNVLTDGVSTVDLGTQGVGTAGTAKTFTVRNVGTATLKVNTTISVTGTNAADFVVNNAGMSPTVAPGGNTAFTVTFTPGAVGARTASMHISSDDPNENPFDVTIQGTGTPPALVSFTANPISGSEADQTAITLTATLDSAPAVDTTVNVSVDTGGGITTGDYTLSPASITVAAGETSGTATFTVVDDSEYEGPEIAHLHATLDSVTRDLNIQIDDNDAPPTTLVVTNTSDADGVCLPGDCSLRQAINSADAATDVSTITFNIPGAGVHTISPADDFSPLVHPTIIDGYTQPGASANTLATGSDAVILIEVDGANINNPFSSGLTTAERLTLSGLAINDYGFGINIQGGTGSVIAGNFIGTDAAGTTFKGNVVASVLIAAGSNVIGGSTPASRNLLVSNGHGIQIAGSSGNTISDNYIGLNAAGDAAIPSGGILLQGSDGNQIGGLTTSERNVIVSVADAIDVAGNNNFIEGNFIGTDATGANGLANLASGIKLLGTSTGNTIGGTAAGAENVIASCGIVNSEDAGVSFVGDTVNSLFPTGNTVAGNLIGTNAAGTAALGNNRGVDLTNAPSNTIGGTASAARNVISGNVLGNVRLQGQHATGNIVKGNFIGTDITGSLPLSISTNNILITATAANNVIGGTAVGAGNTIAFSASGAGVRVDDVGGAGNSVVGNSIFSNGGGGIDIGGQGPTANDALDGDTGDGGDDIQNFPVVTSVTGSGAAATVSGTLNSAPGQTFSIDVYASASCDTSGFGQGRVYLGRQSTGSTDGGGNTTFTLLSAAVPAGMPVITATATNANGSTSEFSQCFTIPAGTVQFNEAARSVDESSFRVAIPVSRANGFAGAASVDFATSNGSAIGGASCTPGVDFIATSGTLNWADGDPFSQAVFVFICDDAVLEGDETFNVTLTNATGAGAGAILSYVVTITDNDEETATVQFSSDAYKGAEGTNVAVTVTRSSSVGSASVDFATSALTPTTGACSIGSGNDYISRSDTIIFADGESEKTFDITLCSDLLIENPAETVGLTLSNPSGATLGTQSSATLTILDVANEFSSNAKIDLTNGVTPVVNYPSPLDVEGVPGGVNGIRLSLIDVNALDAHNIEVLLVSPDNRTFRAMAAVGGNSPLSGATITLEDSAPTQLPQSAAITDGQNYKPASCADPIEDFPAPAPMHPYGEAGCISVNKTFADIFGGVDPNGTWKLYVFEHEGLDRPTTRNDIIPVADGSIGGWGIQFLAPTAAPASVGGRVLTAGGQGIRNTKVVISGGDLAEPMTMYTADFGYYYFSGLTAGKTYVITVEPRRYTISHPTRVVNLIDSLADFDFVADP